MKKVLFSGFCALVLTVTAPIAQAKPLGQIARETGLSPDDFNMLTDAAKSLYSAQPPQPGKIVSWSNKSSMSHGTARLASIRNDCAYIQHQVYPTGKTSPVEIRTQYCKAADGRWLLTTGS